MEFIMHNDCDACRDGLGAVKQKEEESMAKYGWVTHAVQDDDDYPYGINIHTHGLKKNFDHPDLQICFPIDPRIAHTIISNVVGHIKDGKKYRDCEEADEIIENFKVMFVSVSEDQLRIILPDPKGKISVDDIDTKYLCQYKSTPYLLYCKNKLNCEKGFDCGSD